MRIVHIILLLFVFVSFTLWSLYAGKQNKVTEEKFENGLASWISEDASDSAQYVIHHDTLEIISPDGHTFWYDKELEGNYRITYRIKVCMDGKPGDRLADLNCFWGAHDPKHPDNLYARSQWRKGIFERYNSLNLYYVGYGGNENTTTRIRKYHGEKYEEGSAVVKPLIQEYTDSAHLLVPNKWLAIEITMKDGKSSFAVDGETLFSLADDNPYRKGYFGLRLLQNRVMMTAFKIEQLR